MRKVYDKPGLTISVFVCMVIISVSFYLLGIGFVILDIFRKKYKEESKLKDEYLRITKDYVGMVRENAKETRKVRHDLQAHMHILQHYLEQKEYLKALEYLAKMQENMTRAIRKMVSVNHEIVDAVLQEAIVRGEGLQIQWEVDGVFPDNLSITDFDLCTIFSNLLSNSIEACRKLERENRYICLEIRRTEEHLLIEVENPVLTPVALENLGRVTEKDDGENHGFGIANVKATVEKNKGNIYFENKKGIFAVKILFTLEN
ncbi:GHKL domain-containing protein [Lachnospiraceae bacterium 29-84]